MCQTYIKNRYIHFVVTSVHGTYALYITATWLTELPAFRNEKGIINTDLYFSKYSMQH